MCRWEGISSAAPPPSTTPTSTILVPVSYPPSSRQHHPSGLRGLLGWSHGLYKPCFYLCVILTSLFLETALLIPIELVGHSEILIFPHPDCLCSIWIQGMTLLSIKCLIPISPLFHFITVILANTPYLLFIIQRAVAALTQDKQIPAWLWWPQAHNRKNFFSFHRVAHPLKHIFTGYGPLL